MTQSSSNSKKLLNSVRPSKVIYPIAIGFTVAIYMLLKEIDSNTFNEIEFTYYSVLFLFIACVMIVIRDLGYIMRLRILTENEFSWRKAFRIIMLWEFTSAVTPSAIGGTSVAILYLNKEGLSLGKSSAVVMATSFLDELYFIIMFPAFLLFLSTSKLFMIESSDSLFANSVFYLAWGGYILKLAYLFIISYGLFLNPRGLKWLLIWLFKLPILRKWKRDAHNTGTDLVFNSIELKRKPFMFWLKAFFATFYSWTARYWIVNAILLAFWTNAYSLSDHLLIFARQLIMWLMMLVSPTPGGSGFSEWVFAEYLGEFLPSAGIAAAMALIWRLVSYYPYLFIGVYLLPRWIKKNFSKE